MDMEMLLAPLGLTLKVAALATLCAGTAGVGLAFFTTRRRLWGQDWLDAFLTLPLVLPPTVLGYYLIVLVGQNGLVGRWLKERFDVSLIFTWQGAVLAAAIVSFPLVFKSARTSFAAVDKNLERAARTLGKSELAVFFRVSLPLARNGILAGAMLAFARAMGEFGATLMIAGNLPGKTQTLSMAVYDAVQSGDRAVADMLVGVTSLVCMGILYFSGRMLKRDPMS